MTVTCTLFWLVIMYGVGQRTPDGLQHKLDKLLLHPCDINGYLMAHLRTCTSAAAPQSAYLPSVLVTNKLSHASMVLELMLLTQQRTVERQWSIRYTPHMQYENAVAGCPQALPGVS